MTETIDLTYPSIVKEISKYTAEGRTESRAFLIWFLEHYYRLEDIAASDCVCDGPDDKGIDGIYVDDNLERIDVFQARLLQNKSKTIGDRQLRELIGALDQLSNSDKVNHLCASTGNVELKKLIQDRDVASKIRNGYEIKGIFVTNAIVDSNGRNFADKNDRLNICEFEYLSKAYVSPGSSGPIPEQAKFDVSGFDVIEYNTSEAKMLVALLRASELVNLDGIQSGNLFD